MTTLLNYNLKKKTGVVFYSDKKIIRKFSTNGKKNILLNNEYNGFKWYLSKTKKSYMYQLYKKKLIKNINYIDYPLIKGRKISFWTPLKESYTHVEIIMNHYKKFWPKTNKTYYHGDLTIENTIFIKDKYPFIIDWEYSSENNIWGLDICYLLISSVVLPALTNEERKIKATELQLFENLWFKFFKKKKFRLIKYPLQQIIKINKKLIKIRPKKNDFIYKINNFQKNQLLEIINL